MSIGLLVMAIDRPAGLWFVIDRMGDGPGVLFVIRQSLGNWDRLIAVKYSDVGEHEVSVTPREPFLVREARIGEDLQTDRLNRLGGFQRVGVGSRVGIFPRR